MGQNTQFLKMSQAQELKLFSLLGEIEFEPTTTNLKVSQKSHFLLTRNVHPDLVTSGSDPETNHINNLHPTSNNIEK